MTTTKTVTLKVTADVPHNWSDGDLAALVEALLGTGAPGHLAFRDSATFRQAALTLSETAARRSETSLMAGRVSGLARQSDLSADERIGASRAQRVLDRRITELER